MTDLAKSQIIYISPATKLFGAALVKVFTPPRAHGWTTFHQQDRERVLQAATPSRLPEHMMRNIALSGPMAVCAGFRDLAFPVKDANGICLSHRRRGGGHHGAQAVGRAIPSGAKNGGHRPARRCVAHDFNNILAVVIQLQAGCSRRSKTFRFNNWILPARLRRPPNVRPTSPANCCYSAGSRPCRRGNSA